MRVLTLGLGLLVGCIDPTEQCNMAAVGAHDAWALQAALVDELVVRCSAIRSEVNDESRATVLALGAARREVRAAGRDAISRAEAANGRSIHPTSRQGLTIRIMAERLAYDSGSVVRLEGESQSWHVAAVAMRQVCQEMETFGLSLRTTQLAFLDGAVGARDAQADVDMRWVRRRSVNGLKLASGFRIGSETGSSDIELLITDVSAVDLLAARTLGFDSHSACIEVRP